MARRYAQALYDLARERDELAAVRSGLGLVASLLGDEPVFARFFYNPTVRPERKGELLATVLPTLPPLVHRFVQVVAQKRRERYLPAIAREFEALVDQALNIVDVHVTSALPADGFIRETVKPRLEQALGRSVRLHVRVDPDLLGGLVVQVGDRRYDGSLRRRLARLREKVLAGESAR